MSPLPDIVSPERPSAPLSCVPPAVAVLCLLSHPAPSAVVSSSSVANPTESAPLHPALLSALSPLLPPPPRYSSTAPAFLTCWCPCPCPLLAWVIVAVVSSVVLVFAPGLPLVLPSPFLFLHPAPAPSPPSSLGLLQPLAPPQAPLPSAPAADITRKDKYFGNQMGGVEARWLVAGESAPCRKFPERPLTVVGDDISRPRFLHQPQQ